MGKQAIINCICRKIDIIVDFVVVIKMTNENGPEIYLPQNIVSFAASINAEIGFDIYCY